MSFITKIGLKSNIENVNYPFDIPIFQNFDELIIKSPVTFFMGENESGKSTLIEAIAVANGLNAEGGSQNFNFNTVETHSDLYKKLIIFKTGKKASTKFFFES